MGCSIWTMKMITISSIASSSKRLKKNTCWLACCWVLPFITPLYLTLPFRLLFLKNCPAKMDSSRYIFWIYFWNIENLHFFSTGFGRLRAWHLPKYVAGARNDHRYSRWPRANFYGTAYFNVWWNCWARSCARWKKYQGQHFFLLDTCLSGKLMFCYR